jgi:hypothetical protein
METKSNEKNHTILEIAVGKEAMSLLQQADKTKKLVW